MYFFKDNYYLPALVLFLICLIIIYFYIKSKAPLNKINTTFSSDTDLLYFYVYLNKLYIKNVYLTYMRISLFFIITVFIVLIIRIYLIGTEHELYTIHLGFVLNMKRLPLIITFILCYIYFMKIIKLLLYPEILRMHIYLQNNKKYIAIEDWYKEHCFGYFDSQRNKLSLFLIHTALYVNNPTEYSSFEIVDEFNVYDKSYTEKIHNIRKFLKPRPNLLKILCFIYYFITRRFWLRMTDLFYYMPHMFLIFTLIYDICIHGKFYYIYYALLLYVISNINKKIRQFMYEKDPMLDRQLYDIFYDDDCVYIETHQIINILEKTKVFTKEIKGKLANTYFADIEELAAYFKEDFKVYYARESDSRTGTFRETRLRLKRYLMIILNIIFFIILFYKKTQFVFTINTIVLPLSLLIIPTIIMLIINPFIATLNKTKDNYIINNKYKTLFWLSFILQSIIFIFIFIKNKLLFCPDPILFDFWNIQLIQQFTVQDKVNFIYTIVKQYGQLIGVEDIHINTILTILDRISVKDFIDDSTSFKQLLKYCEELYNIYLNLLPSNYNMLEINLINDLIHEHKLFVHKYNALIVCIIFLGIGFNLYVKEPIANTIKFFGL